MKGLVNQKNNKMENKELFAHISYRISDKCKSNETYGICHKCEKCGRKFDKSGIKISSI